MILPTPFDPLLDPLARGLRFLVDDASARNVADVAVPGGAYDGTRGWTTTVRSWKYRDRTGSGVVRIGLKLSAATPGLIRVTMKGRNGTWPVSPHALPVKVTIVLDPPCAPTGECGVATFPGPSPSCALERGGAMLLCR